MYICYSIIFEFKSVKRSLVSVLQCIYIWLLQIKSDIDDINIDIDI